MAKAPYSIDSELDALIKKYSSPRHQRSVDVAVGKAHSAMLRRRGGTVTLLRQIAMGVAVFGSVFAIVTMLAMAVGWPPPAPKPTEQETPNVPSEGIFKVE